MFNLLLPPVAEHEQSALTRVFAQPLRHQRVQAVEALAHVARLHRHEHFQAAGKTQHGLANARNTSAANAA